MVNLVSEELRIGIMAKHLWAVSSKQNSLWVNRSWKYVIKNLSFLFLFIDVEKIVELRLVRPFIKCIIRNGSSTYYWHDSRHPAGPLIDNYSSLSWFLVFLWLQRSPALSIMKSGHGLPSLFVPPPFSPIPCLLTQLYVMVPPPTSIKLLMLGMFLELLVIWQKIV